MVSPLTWLNGINPFITATDLPMTSHGHTVSNVHGIVDDLNKKYINGKSSTDFGEAGVVLRIIDGICDAFDDPTAVCNHNMANSPPEVFFGGTIHGRDDLVSTLHNDAISTPTDQGGEIPVYKAWEVSKALSYCCSYS